jgi:hypothetical protein
MRVRPVSPDGLVSELTELVLSQEPDSHLRVGVDGPAAGAPGRLADALVDPLPDSFYLGWFDEKGLAREVLGPAGPGGSGRVLTRLWNAGTDRAARDPYTVLPPGAVLLVSGPLLLGGGLTFDLTVHLELSPAALRRRTPPDEQWTLPAFERYAGEVAPAGFADLVVRADDPRHPAIVSERW